MYYNNVHDRRIVLLEDNIGTYIFFGGFIKRNNLIIF